MKNKNNMFELLKDDKSRKTILLGFYLLFMFFLIILSRTGSKDNYQVLSESKENDIEEISAFETLNQVHNYQYKYITKDGIIEGTRYNEENLFTFDNDTYYIDKDNIYLVQDNYIIETDKKFEYLFLYKSEDIYLLLKNSKPTLELDIDGVTTKEYLFEDFKITTQEDSIINKVLVKSNEDEIEINFMNVGKVNKLNTNFEKKDF